MTFIAIREDTLQRAFLPVVFTRRFLRFASPKKTCSISVLVLKILQLATHDCSLRVADRSRVRNRLPWVSVYLRQRYGGMRTVLYGASTLSWGRDVVCGTVFVRTVYACASWWSLVCLLWWYNCMYNVGGPVRSRHVLVEWQATCIGPAYIGYLCLPIQNMGSRWLVIALPIYGGIIKGNP